MNTDKNKQWHEQPCFQRYWKHYAQTYDWYRYHLNTWDKISESNNPSWETRKLKTPNSHQEETSDDRSSYKGDDEDSEAVIEMEITDELVAFFEQSETHRKELSKLTNITVLCYFDINQDTIIILEVLREQTKQQKQADFAKAIMKPGKINSQLNP